MSDLEEVSFPIHTFDGKQYIAVEDAEVLRQLIETGGRIDGELRAEIERLRAQIAEKDVALRYYAEKKQKDWVNVTGADDGVVARAALEEKE